MFSRILKISLLLILISAFVLPSFFVFARPTAREEKRQLEEELQKLEEQLLNIETDITRTEKEKRTLRNQVYLLRKRIERLELEIRRSNAHIRELELEIADTGESIEKTISEIENSKENLVIILRTIYKEDQKSDLEILLSGESISDYFNHLANLKSLNLENQEILENIKTAKALLENQKESLTGDKDDLERIVRIQTLQREESRAEREQQNRLLRMTEAQHQQYLKEKQELGKRATEIRARIFELIGVPEAPTFGEALELAEWVQGQTGIRPAFLLAIITQESRLGRNVGQCYLSEEGIKTGEGIIRRTRERTVRTMNPRRDVPHFLTITRELNRDPFGTPVSCVMWRDGSPVGWGGAMGPAQFIPSTWANRRSILEPFVEGIPNPWDTRHAFLASALYLRDLGGQDNERRAALQYFAGGNWANPRFASYGDQVVRRTNCLQTFIDHGTMTERCEGLIFIPK